MGATFLPHETNGVHHPVDEQIDSLYAWMPAQTAPQPCPEATFSLTLKGTLDGVEALFTVRGQTASEFKTNLAAVRELLDAPAAPPTQASSQDGQGWCSKHNVQMKENVKDGRRWYSHQIDGRWCKGK